MGVIASLEKAKQSPALSLTQGDCFSQGIPSGRPFGPRNDSVAELRFTTFSILFSISRRRLLRSFFPRNDSVAELSFTTFFIQAGIRN